MTKSTHPVSTTGSATTEELQLLQDLNGLEQVLDMQKALLQAVRRRFLQTTSDAAASPPESPS